MTFSVAERDINFPIMRFVSENQRWEVGISPVLFGMRVRAGIVGSDWVHVDYCAGANRAFALLLLATVVEILSTLPEDISGGEVERMMPAWKRRPIDQDECWPKLQQLRDELTTKRTLHAERP